MQPGSRLVEDKQIPDFGFRIPDFGLAVCPKFDFRCLVFGVFRLRQVPNQFQSLRFAAGKCVQRLTKAEISEPDFLEHFEPVRNLTAAIHPHLALRVRLPRDRDLGGALRGLR